MIETQKYLVNGATKASNVEATNNELVTSFETNIREIGDQTISFS
ncbi:MULTISPECIES: hypothetical protein [Bacillus]|nr:hypothetical protein [Bacillus rhizoplanae]